MKLIKWLPHYWLPYDLIWVLSAFFGLYEWLLYRKLAQGNRLKYNGKLPDENPSDVFWFKSRHIDSCLRILFHAVPIWTALEVDILYCYATGIVPCINFSEHPYYLLCFTIVMPIIHETLFYVIHRIIH